MRKESDVEREKEKDRAGTGGGRGLGGVIGRSKMRIIRDGRKRWQKRGLVDSQ